jgi:hypothetical protein
MAVAMTFEDREISGASITNRPGFLSLMRAAEARLFDVIVAEDLVVHTWRGLEAVVRDGRRGNLSGDAKDQAAAQPGWRDRIAQTAATVVGFLAVWLLRGRHVIGGVEHTAGAVLGLHRERHLQQWPQGLTVGNRNTGV